MTKHARHTTLARGTERASVLAMEIDELIGTNLCVLDGGDIPAGKLRVEDGNTGRFLFDGAIATVNAKLELVRSVARSARSVA